jgi:hypothetical protein
MTTSKEIEIAKGINFLRLICFCIFFTIGGSAVVLSILTGELETYYRNRNLPIRIKQMNEDISRLTAKYEMQITQIREDPAILRHLESVTFGTVPQSNEAIFPKASGDALLAAKEALSATMNQPLGPDPLPKWLARIAGPDNQRMRLTLLVAGLGLVMVTFIFFGRTLRPSTPEDPTPNPN